MPLPYCRKCHTADLRPSWRSRGIKEIHASAKETGKMNFTGRVFLFQAVAGHARGKMFQINSPGAANQK